jgi:peptidoglycan hydrolase-like protein with peptidoglycan-binding domain
MHRSTTRKTSTRTTKGRRPAPARTYGQIEPTPGRYREIQQALIEKGYLRGDASGKWDGDSADALKRFQGDQSLEASGKLDSLSLIALGLGPKRTASAQARP